MDDTRIKEVEKLYDSGFRTGGFTLEFIAEIKRLRKLVKKAFKEGIEYAPDYTQDAKAINHEWNKHSKIRTELDN